MHLLVNINILTSDIFSINFKKEGFFGFVFLSNDYNVQIAIAEKLL